MLKQFLQQKLLQKLSPQQIQLMKLLQVPTAELEQRVKEEVEINPALEEGADENEGKDENDEFSNDEEFGKENDDSRNDFDINDYLDDDMPAYKTQASNRGSDDEEKTIPIVSGDSFQEGLIAQINLRLLNEKQKQIATYIIGNLDDSGYLRRETENIVDDLAFSQNITTTIEEVERVLAVIQELDPPGIGARSLQECLILQLRKKEADTFAIENAIEIIENNFEEFTKKHYDKIQKKLNLTDELLKEAIDEIIHLNPKPGNSAREAGRGVVHIIPDFLLSEENGKLELSLNSRNAPQLRISKDYEEMLRTYAENKTDKKAKEAVQFVRQRIDSAKWFIDAIRQRQQTLLMVMNAIMEYQRDYFISGDETKLRPMILKDIADVVGMDISTVSRVANSKYVQTHFGTFLLKTFFSESLSTDTGEEVSTREVKKILEESITAEHKRKPLTDDQLAVLLKEKGYNIARRTVAKYREQLNIPVARLRKEL